ncbi:MAG: holin [Oscillospiraceae bacterium]|nr:holin [Oscillospiraceae bacterium]
MNIMNAAWWKAAGARAVRTVAQTAVAMIGTTAVSLGNVDWALACSTAVLAGILSLLTSLTGLPEVTADE